MLEPLDRHLTLPARIQRLAVIRFQQHQRDQFTFAGSGGNPGDASHFGRSGTKAHHAGKAELPVALDGDSEPLASAPVDFRVQHLSIQEGIAIDHREGDGYVVGTGLP